jgi:putative MATE family efflux protein
MSCSLVCGIIFSLVGLLISSPALTLMDTKPEILDNAVLYMRIICAGIPASAVYNFGATILRSVGDSKTPLIILSSSGLVNVALNLVFVIAFDMSVAGVALATIMSQVISAVAIVIVLHNRRSLNYGLTFSKLGIEKAMLLRILRFGIPAGIQGSLFSISNVIITTAANSFSTAVVSAKTIAGNIDGLLYTALNSYMHASMTFTGQNYGAKKVDRIKKSTLYGIVQVLFIGTTIALLMMNFSRELASLYVDKAAAPEFNSEVLDYSVEILALMLPAYALCGTMETLAGSLRGLGYSYTPMIVNLIGSCGSRILWVFVFFPMDAFHSIIGLYLIYPISWILTSAAHLTVLAFAWKRMRKEFSKEEALAEPA